MSTVRLPLYSAEERNSYRFEYIMTELQFLSEVGYFFKTGYNFKDALGNCTPEWLLPCCYGVARVLGVFVSMFVSSFYVAHVERTQFKVYLKFWSLHMAHIA